MERRQRKGVEGGGNAIHQGKGARNISGILTLNGAESWGKLEGRVGQKCGPGPPGSGTHDN